MREDALDLFGFPTETERRAFRLLLSIPNVGPKTALGVLSALSVSELGAGGRARADLPRLSKVPGIGKKTAERLVLELKDKLPGCRRRGAPALGRAHLGCQTATVERAHQHGLPRRRKPNGPSPSLGSKVEERRSASS